MAPKNESSYSHHKFSACTSQTCINISTSAAPNHTELMLNQLEWCHGHHCGDDMKDDVRFVSNANKTQLQGNLMHCTARGNIAHNFLWLKEGAIYSVKNFTVLPNKDEFRVMRFADFMLEFHGDTTVWKAFVRSGGFIRYHFQLVKIDALEPTNNKYLIGKGAVNKSDAVGTSSTLIVDDEQIPVLKRLKTDDSDEGDIGSDTCNIHWSTLLKVHVLTLEISDDTVEVAVVMFDETSRSLLKCSASSIVGFEDQDEEENSGLPPALANIVGTSHTLELKSHTYYEHGIYESFIAYEDVEESASSGMVAANAEPKALVLKILTVTPSVAIPSKPGEEKKQRREELQDSDADESFDC
ncbi:hypothetical protein Tco_0942896 [Tanacetum coccineum]